MRSRGTETAIAVVVVAIALTVIGDAAGTAFIWWLDLVRRWTAGYPPVVNFVCSVFPPILMMSAYIGVREYQRERKALSK